MSRGISRRVGAVCVAKEVRVHLPSPLRGQPSLEPQRKPSPWREAHEMHPL